MNIISAWIKRRKERKDEEMKRINDELMSRGYLCPNYDLHERELLDWEGDVRYMVCKRCGDKTVAMARVTLAERAKPENQL